MPLFIKDPDATLDYGVTLASWLATGETVSTATWSVETGITVATGFPNFTGGYYNNGTIMMVALQGGTAGFRYNCTVRFVTTAGRTDDRSFEILVQER